MRVSEIFLSLQGEGPSTGAPASFLRLQGCDVGCVWCDTRYSWDPSAGREMRGDEIWSELEKLGATGLLVVTGGEPLQHPGIEPLLRGAVERWPRVEVETSGIGPPPFSHPRLHFNVSPKLPSATSRWRQTWQHSSAWTADPNAIFKLVVGADPDPGDALRLIGEHGLPRERVLLMPEGKTGAEVAARAREVAELCKRERLRMSPRLHVWLWGPARGR
jgi:7-carboxy-7-deazaguanine synthase